MVCHYHYDSEIVISCLGLVDLVDLPHPSKIVYVGRGVHHVHQVRYVLRVYRYVPCLEIYRSETTTLLFCGIKLTYTWSLHKTKLYKNMKVIDQAVLHILSDQWMNFIDQTIEKYIRMIISYGITICGM